MHSDSSGAGLTMPATDIEGNERPLGVLFDCGSNDAFPTPVASCADVLLGAPIIGVPVINQSLPVGSCSDILFGAPQIGVPKINEPFHSAGEFIKVPVQNDRIIVPRLQ